LIIYEGMKNDFIKDIEAGLLIKKLKTNFKDNHIGTSEPEINSWRNSLQYMHMVLKDDGIPANSGVAIEYRMPTSSKRIDFLLTGTTPGAHKAAIIIELKQWTSAKIVENKDGIVKTLTGGAIREVLHPSYQAWSYQRE